MIDSRQGQPVVRLTLKEPSIYDKRRDLENLSSHSFLKGMMIKPQASQSNTKSDATLNSLLQSLKSYTKK
jgi:hypothetical protein